METTERLHVLFSFPVLLVETETVLIDITPVSSQIPVCFSDLFSGEYSRQGWRGCRSLGFSVWFSSLWYSVLVTLAALSFLCSQICFFNSVSSLGSTWISPVWWLDILEAGSQVNHEVKVKVTQSCPTVYDPMEYTVHGILQARKLEWVAFPFSRGLPKPGIAPRSPTLQADSLPAESSGEPKNTEVSSLSILQWIFPTQESNRSPALQADSSPTGL